RPHCTDCSEKFAISECPLSRSLPSKSPSSNQSHLKEMYQLMTTTVRAGSDISGPVASRTNGHTDRGVQINSAGSRMTYSRLFGALFLVGFLFYGVGAALVTSVTGAPDFLSTISAHQTTLV